MASKPALSKTRLEMLSRCGMQYQFRYVEGIVARPAVSMIEGTAVHQVIHENLIHKRERGTLLSEDHIGDLAVDALKATWLGEDPRLDEEEQKLGEKIVKAMSIDRSVRLSKMHNQRLAPIIQPIYLERQFSLNMKGYPFDLRGAIDIQESTTLRDSKTIRQTPNQGMADRNLQLDVYHFASSVLDPKPPAKLMLDFLIGQKKVTSETFETTRGPEDHKALMQRFEIACSTVEEGTFMPASPDAWQCSAGWCGYFERCPFGAVKRATFGQVGVDQ